MIIKKWLSSKKGEKILDVACGMGYWSKIVSNVGGEYFGLDLNYKDVMKAKKRFVIGSFIKW